MDTDTPHRLRSAPRWAVVAAYAVPVCILPSAVWRFVGAIDGTLAGPDSGGTPVWYPVLLSAVSLGLGLLTLGLVHPWGERVPRWIPWIGGRPVPIRAAVIPATVGAVLLLGLAGYAVYAATAIERIDPDVVLLGDPPEDLRMMRDSDPEMFREVLWTYGPLAAWPVLLLAVTYAYYRRRTRADS